MTEEKILEVVAAYRKLFEEKRIPKERMDPKRTMGQLTSAERLAHAHYLLDTVEELVRDHEKKGRTGRHLSFVQAILSFENWYTIENLMNHNRPDRELGPISMLTVAERKALNTDYPSSSQEVVREEADHTQHLRR
jgi:hypothetical protein